LIRHYAILPDYFAFLISFSLLPLRYCLRRFFFSLMPIDTPLTHIFDNDMLR